MHWLTDPFQAEFMRRAFLAAVIIGVVAPVVGTWVVLRRMANLGDAMAHGTLGGVGIAYAAGVNVLFGAVGAGHPGGRYGLFTSSAKGRLRALICRPATTEVPITSMGVEPSMASAVAVSGVSSSVCPSWFSARKEFLPMVSLTEEFGAQTTQNSISLQEPRRS